MEANKKKAVIVMASVAFCGVVSVIWYMSYNVDRIVTDDAYIHGRIHSVAAKVSGTVRSVEVGDNQGVKVGSLLVEIDPADYELKVHEAQTAVDAAIAKVQDAQAGIKAAEADMYIQKVAFDQAGRDAQRAQALFKEGVITREKNERAGNLFDLAQAKVKASEQLLQKAIAAKELEDSLVKQKEAALQIAKRNLSYTRIIAGTDGYVTSKSVEAGNQIQSGQPLMALVALDDIWVVANFKETQLKKVRPGQAVEIRVDMYPGKRFTGRVESIMAGTGAMFSLFPPENALGNYVKVVQRIPVKIVLDKGSDSKRILRIGMSCVPTIITKDE